MSRSCIGLLLTIAGLAVADAMPAAGQTAPSAADSAAIRQTALDYIEGWYQGNAERMRRAVHPDLAKRIIERSGAGSSRVGHMTAEQLVNATSRPAGGARTANGRSDVRILDVFGAAASVRVDADEWVDYLHIGRTDEGWKIINVLWELRGR